MTVEIKHNVVFFSDCAYFAGGAEVCLFDVLDDPSVVPLLVVPEVGEIAQEARRRMIPIKIISLGVVAGIRRPFKIRDGIAAMKDAARAASDLKAAARSHGALCIHTNGLKSHGIACLARLLGGPPVVSYMRSIPFTPAERAFWWAVRLISSTLILVSRPCWHGRVLPSNAVVVHDGIAPPDKKLKARAFHQPLRIGFAGRLHPNKNVELLIEWFDHAHRKGFPAILIIRGEAHSDQKCYAENLKTMVRERGLTERVHFEGKVQGLDRIYGDLDVNVVPSKVADPFPRSVMEALAMGVPVIGYPAGGIPDMIEDGRTGYLAQDADSFLSALRRLTKDEETYNSIRRNALAFVCKELSLENLYRNLSAVYQRIST